MLPDFLSEHSVALSLTGVPMEKRTYRNQIGREKKTFKKLGCHAIREIKILPSEKKVPSKM